MHSLANYRSLWVYAPASQVTAWLSNKQSTLWLLIQKKRKPHQSTSQIRDDLTACHYFRQPVGFMHKTIFRELERYGSFGFFLPPHQKLIISLIFISLAIIIKNIFIFLLIRFSYLFTYLLHTLKQSTAQSDEW